MSTTKSWTDLQHKQDGKHNHPDKTNKHAGECPACDAYWERDERRRKAASESM